MLERATGSSNLVFPNGKQDEGREDGLLFQDFVEHERSVAAGLDEEEVLSLRLYTTAAYKSINKHLRDKTAPNPFAATIAFLHTGIKKLRDTSGSNARNGTQIDLFRGMRDLSLLGTNFMTHRSTVY